MFDRSTIQAVEQMATRLKIEPAVLLAVAEIESNGVVFAMVNGKQEPLIRWEGHYFDQRLSGTKRDEARRQGFANPKAGAVKNPASQAARYRLLASASQIDKVAAFESCSWGIGQVMGAHWQWLGYATPGEMLKELRSGAAGQIAVMVRYIEKAGLVGALRRLDFTEFARGYNGPAFAKYGYHTKMAAAYQRRAGKAPVSAAHGMLRMGSAQ